MAGRIAGDTEVAWAAGFWDGEGCTYLRWQHPHGKLVAPAIYLEVSQKGATLLHRFVRAVGLTSTVRPTHRGDKRDIHRISVCRKSDVAKVMRALWPYLGQPKRDQYSLCVEALQEYRHG